MGLIKEALKTIVIADAQRQGFRDGVGGKPVAFQFTEAFPQNTELAVAYHKGYGNGQSGAFPRALNKGSESK